MPQKEDEVHVSGQQGTQVLTVRQDTVAALAGADGDYQPLSTDADGRLYVIDSEVNLFASAGKTVIGNLEYLALNNTQGTTEIHANTASSRFAFMGLQGATNTTGATVSIQDRTSGTVLVGPIPTIVNTGIVGFLMTGYPYAISADDTGLQIVVSGSARIDGVLQFLEVANA